MSEENILEKEDVGKLLRKFAIPSVVSMLVISLYNIVDQFFIGQKVGSLGNAATNVSFPIMTMCIALMLTFGIGSSAGFNINMGAGNKKVAKKFVGCGFGMLFISGTVIAIITELFLPQLLMFCGSTKSILPFAVEYMRIIAIGFPFVIFANGGAHLVRADGSPVYSMLSNMAGAITNTILDYIFYIDTKKNDETYYREKSRSFQKISQHLSDLIENVQITDVVGNSIRKPIVKRGDKFEVTEQPKQTSHSKKSKK